MGRGSSFVGDQLRLARFAQGITLDELGQRVAATRQYLNQLEIGVKQPAPDMVEALSAALGVTVRFFSLEMKDPVRPEQCHFRKQATTPVSVVSQVVARGTLLERFVRRLDEALDLPPVSFPDVPAGTPEEIEEAAEAARTHWQLGGGPITSMMRVVENAGAVVSFFGGVSERVDALSIDRPRPLIIRSDAKQSPARLRFDLAHECGHLIMHRGVQTGDRVSEEQANRFASAFLLPRSAIAQEFPQGRHLNWTAIYNIKVRWRVSAAAIIRRAYDLGLITADQYRTGYIHLRKTGQSRVERGDELLPPEEPEVLKAALNVLERAYPGAPGRIAEDVCITPDMFANIAGTDLPIGPTVRENIVPFLRAGA